MATDNFNRANGAPGANWAQAFPGFSVPPIASNRLTWPQFPSLYWATAMGPDQSGSVQLQAGLGGSIMLRLTSPNTGSETCYRINFQLGSPYSAELFRIVAGVQTSLGYFNFTMDPADIWVKCSAVGNLISLYGSADGVTWNLRRTWTDSDPAVILTAGFVGLASANNGAGPYGSLDDFEALSITPYTQTVWQDGVTPVNAVNMNHIEQGINDAAAAAQAANVSASLLTANQTPIVAGGRLFTEAKLVTDWNSAQENGWYRAGPGTNSPSAFAGTLVIGRVERAQGFVTQTCWQYALSNAALAPKYERRYDGSWGPWILIASDPSLFIPLTQKAAASGVASLDSASRVVQQHTVDKLYASGVGEGFSPVARSGVAVWEAAVAPLPNLPIALQTPRSSTLGGNSFWTVLAQTNYDWGHWEFVKDVDGYIYGQVRTQTARAAATIIVAIAANAVAGVTRMQAGYAIVPDGSSLNPAFTDAAAQDVTVPATAYLRKDVTFALGALAAGDLVLVRLFHAGAHANDTLAVNTLIAGAWIGGT